MRESPRDPEKLPLSQGEKHPSFRHDAWRVLYHSLGLRELCFYPRGPVTGLEDPAALLLMWASYQVIPPTGWFLLVIIPCPGPQPGQQPWCLHPQAQAPPQHSQLLLDSTETGNPDSTVSVGIITRNTGKCGLSTTSLIKRKQALEFLVPTWVLLLINQP